MAPNTQSGNVVLDPATKFVITKSSIESANASRPPAITPGRMIGSVTLKNVVLGSAPRSPRGFLERPVHALGRAPAP